jgi:hypothetical protein
MHGRLRRLHGVMLVVDRGGRAGEVIDLVNLDIKREGDIVTDELEARVAGQMLNVTLASKAGSKFLFYRASLSENRFTLFRTHSSGLRPSI